MESEYQIVVQVLAGKTNDFRRLLEKYHQPVFRLARNLMGDNRDGSKDSRHFGSIHVGDVIGYVDYVYFPAEAWSRFGAYRDEGMTQEQSRLSLRESTLFHGVKGDKIRKLFLMRS